MAPPYNETDLVNSSTNGKTSPGTEKILPNILDDIGHTPLVRLNRLPKEEGVKAEILVKCEFRNPGGSLKDRVVYKMIRDAEAKGDLKPGMTIIEPTSGNTGISVAMLSAVLGYKAILCINDKMSKEKADIMASMGALVVRSSKLPHEHSPDSHIGIAKRLNSLIPDSFILNQYYNDANPLAHFEGTAQEIIDDCGGRLDYVVMGGGTCGTLSGVGRKMREAMPHVRVVGVDPEGSLLARDEDIRAKTTNHGLVEGIGHKFKPGVLDRSVVDEWVKCHDHASFDMARRIIRSEGLLVGGSAGAVLWAAFETAKKHNLTEKDRVVVILADGIRNYITHFVSNDWMDARAYPYSPVAHHAPWRTKHLDARHKVISTPTLTMSLEHGAKAMRANDAVYMAIQDEQTKVLGIASLGDVEYEMSSKRSAPEKEIAKHVLPNFALHPVGRPLTLAECADYFKRAPLVVLVNDAAATAGRAELRVADVHGVVDADLYAKEMVRHQ